MEGRVQGSPGEKDDHFELKTFFLNIPEKKTKSETPVSCITEHQK